MEVEASFLPLTLKVVFQDDGHFQSAFRPLARRFLYFLAILLPQNVLDDHFDVFLLLPLLLLFLHLVVLKGGALMLEAAAEVCHQQLFLEGLIFFFVLRRPGILGLKFPDEGFPLGSICNRGDGVVPL